MTKLEHYDRWFLANKDKDKEALNPFIDYHYHPGQILPSSI